MEVSGKIIEARSSLGITQSELAEEINVTERTISNWENGARPARVSNYRKLAKVFNCSLDYLMKDSVDSKEETQTYLELGRNISKIVNFSSCASFWSKYAICEKESTLLLPVESSIGLMEKLSKGVTYHYYLNPSKACKLAKLARDFLFKWHKFNRSNLQLSKTSKTSMLIAQEKIFVDSSDCTIHLPLFPQKPTLFLRNLLINSIRHEENLDNYASNIKDPEYKELIEFVEDEIKQDKWLS
ncbi:helix-turn-helix domain-containing protein [Companilactobacillus mishanensis]|uniref:Helix-turn-helix transcriptional regulator n=1 Tax=Companilactobacillus mishanensis TaxID=2486008 RepID=A0A5P0ZHZ3_9LACO|nr:helix-turn-helix transcriptional regulator [Companilactobacillus mishanensis]MQS52680.1 helix-turn-helix transcriptional regulator [Companilactobacillus mishanensis]